MKIGLCGTMSVGKTTLVNALQEVPEFKDYVTRTERSKELMAMGIPLNTDSTLKGQCVFLAERATELMHENIITDRTIIDIIAFTKAAKSINYHDADDFAQLASRLISEYDYVFYISPEGVDMEDNGVRETDLEYRALIDVIIQNNITRFRHKFKNYAVIQGSTEERIKAVKEALSL